jgi:hypothetical protein
LAQQDNLELMEQLVKLDQLVQQGNLEWMGPQGQLVKLGHKGHRV